MSSLFWIFLVYFNGLYEKSFFNVKDISESFKSHSGLSPRNLTLKKYDLLSSKSSAHALHDCVFKKNIYPIFVLAKSLKLANLIANVFNKTQKLGETAEMTSKMPFSKLKSYFGK